MLDYTGKDLRRADHIVAIKKPVAVEAVCALQDGAVATLEGAMAYRKGDFILTGCAGESWPVTEAYFNKYYSKDDSGNYISSSYEVLALQADEEFCIRQNGGLLTGETGDWLVQYETGSYGVVKRELFMKLYEIKD